MKRIIIEEFMTDQLKLNGNQLILYAMMWKDSDGGQQPVKDDYRHYSEAMNVTLPTYYNTMKKLADRGLVKNMGDGNYTVMAA